MAEIYITGINLHTVKLLNNKLLKIYSPDHGLVMLSGTKLGGRSEPFVINKYHIRITPNKDIFHIKQSEFVSHYTSINTHYELMSWSWYIAELYSIFSHFNDSQSQELYELLCNTLTAFQYYNPEEFSYRIIALEFLWEFIGLIGFCPNYEDFIGNIYDDYLLDLDNGKFIPALDNNTLNKNNQYHLIQLLPKVQDALHSLIHGQYHKIDTIQQPIVIKILQQYLHHRSDKPIHSMKTLP